jgi:hypothetical protein
VVSDHQTKHRRFLSIDRRCNLREHAAPELDASENIQSRIVVELVEVNPAARIRSLVEALMSEIEPRADSDVCRPPAISGGQRQTVDDFGI